MVAEFSEQRWWLGLLVVELLYNQVSLKVVQRRVRVVFGCRKEKGREAFLRFVEVELLAVTLVYLPLLHI